MSFGAKCRILIPTKLRFTKLEKKIRRYIQWPDGRVVDVRDCKSRYPGSIPGPASIITKVNYKF